MRSAFNHYIYAYIRADGTPYYIGQGVGRRCYAPHGKHIAVPKDKKRIVLMETNLSQIGALALERRYISWHGRKANKSGILRNLTDGGEGIAGYRHTEEYKKQSSESRKGANSYWYGKKIPQEFIERSRMARRGMKLTDDHKKKIAKSNTGKVVSEETRLKLSIANKGKPAWNKGKQFSDETKHRMSEARKGSKSCMFGKKKSDDVKKKISIAMQGKKQKTSVCPHCKKVGGSIMKRWHFDNCKLKKE